MTELKAITSGKIYNIIEYDGSCITDDLYYPKSEADKVIDHQKYKRCLAMAMWCESEAYIHEHGSDYDEDLVAWFGKWYKRWLKLADKFKPNNEVNND